MEKNTKRYTIEGSKYQFDGESFGKEFTRYRKSRGMGVEEAKKELADTLYVSISAIHNWRQGINAPGDLEKIKDIAEIFEIDYICLLAKFDNKKLNQDNEVKTMTMDLMQKESLKRIYDVIIDFLTEFKKTMGFTGDLWYEFQDRGLAKREIIRRINDYVEEKVNYIRLVVLKEYFYLHDTKVYDKIEEFIDGKLIDMFNDKIDISYRGAADFDGEGISTMRDYHDALNELNGIIMSCLR